MTAERPSASRWPVLATAILLESCAGVSYVFALYSSSLKTRFGLSQRSVDLVGTAENFSGFIGGYVGGVYVRCGPRKALILAGVLAVPAWVLMWACLKADFYTAPLWLLMCLAFLQGNGATIFDGVAVSVAASSFPERRGQALGLVKSFIGISAALFSSNFVGFFQPDVPSFILFIGIEYAIVCVVGASVLSRPPTGGDDTGHECAPNRRLSLAMSWVLLLMVLLIGGSLVASSALAPPALPTYLAGTIFCIFLGGLLYISSPMSPMASSQLPLTQQQPPSAKQQASAQQEPLSAQQQSAQLPQYPPGFDPLSAASYKQLSRTTKRADSSRTSTRPSSLSTVFPQPLAAPSARMHVAKSRDLLSYESALLLSILLRVIRGRQTHDTPAHDASLVDATPLIPFSVAAHR